MCIDIYVYMYEHTYILILMRAFVSTQYSLHNPVPWINWGGPIAVADFGAAEIWVVWTSGIDIDTDIVFCFL